ncbi:hypothetical protein E2C01_075645 [Portunus trituberculatus]|uniref:Uncharacterized protein n=1 Tax=Portunus trituberculatus TaxID=210409 RepID=A0A5B7IFK5_PORTR|nr:hypothetical protein [Portunus trituberculatus]
MLRSPRRALQPSYPNPTSSLFPPFPALLVGLTGFPGRREVRRRGVVACGAVRVVSEGRGGGGGW